jgi:hypothetical protein
MKMPDFCAKYRTAKFYAEAGIQFAAAKSGKFVTSFLLNFKFFLTFLFDIDACSYSFLKLILPF